MPFLSVITILLIFQLVGELVAVALELPVPGPVLGMMMIFLVLLYRNKVANELRQGTEQLLSHLSLLFIPAGVGVMVHVARLEQEWLAILVALLMSTVLGLLVTAWTMQIMMKWMSSKAEN